MGSQSPRKETSGVNILFHKQLSFLNSWKFIPEISSEKMVYFSSWKLWGSPALQTSSAYLPSNWNPSSLTTLICLALKSPAFEGNHTFYFLSMLDSGSVFCLLHFLKLSDDRDVRMGGVMSQCGCCDRYAHHYLHNRHLCAPFHTL